MSRSGWRRAGHRSDMLYDAQPSRKQKHLFALATTKYLEQFPWQVFCTLTFKEDVRLATASYHFRNFCFHLGHDFGLRIGGFGYIAQLGTRHHIHALLLSTGLGLSKVPLRGIVSTWMNPPTDVQPIRGFGKVKRVEFLCFSKLAGYLSRHYCGIKADLCELEIYGEDLLRVYGPRTSISDQELVKVYAKSPAFN